MQQSSLTPRVSRRPANSSISRLLIVVIFCHFECSLQTVKGEVCLPHACLVIVHFTFVSNKRLHGHCLLSFVSGIKLVVVKPLYDTFIVRLA